MKADTWEQINEHFHRVLELKTVDREAYLCALKNSSLEEEVRSLIESHNNAKTFLSLPLVHHFPEALEQSRPLDPYQNGTQVGDFLILKKLGSGGFGTVYLGKQLSLEREVALKVSANLGEEAKTMAHLEHENIVKVFSQSIDEERDLRLICMQYVAGCSLDEALRHVGHSVEDGRNWLDTIDRLCPEGSTLNPAALRYREQISRMDFVETVLWTGARLSDALAYAHKRGILHLDVKPGNIMLDSYGQPLLTDFNISANQLDGGAKVIGGTFQYMAPEHKLAFEAASTKDISSPIDERADIYSLGTVLEECLERTPDYHWEEGAVGKNILEIKNVLAKARAKNPSDRFESAREFAAALDGLLELREIAKAMPPAGPLIQFANRHPIWALSLSALIPQLLGSVVNISYNTLRIVSTLNEAQQAIFQKLVLAYNGVIYPIAILILVRILLAIKKYTNAPHERAQLKTSRLVELRTHILSFPRWLILLTTFGWIPGMLYFPLSLHLLSGPISVEVFGHFFTSFLLSWLVALTYSYLFSKFVSLRVLYPQFWTCQGDIQATAQRELKHELPRTRLFYFLGGMVPLSAALVVVLAMTAETISAHYATFQTLLSVLIFLGMVGLITSVKNTLTRVILALTGNQS